MYDYKIKELVKVVDGDTVDVVVDLGFYIYSEKRFRVAGVDTPELRGDEREAGLAAKAFVEQWFTEHTDIRVFSLKDRRDGFRRWIGDFSGFKNDIITPKYLSEELIQAGHAKIYEA